MHHAEQLLAAVAPLGLEPGAAWAVVYLVNDYTLGHALRVAHAKEASPHNYPMFNPSEFPYLAEALAAGGPERGLATFEAGVDAVLDGIERRLG